MDLGGCVHGTGSGVECVLDLATEEGQDADDDESDERDEQAILDEGLTLFFLQKLFDHDDLYVYPFASPDWRKLALWSREEGDSALFAPGLDSPIRSTLLLTM